MSSAVERWAASGLMALTGHADAPPLMPQRDYPGRIESLLGLLTERAALCGASVPADWRYLTERAALLGLKRNGRLSAGGVCRLLPARDGWLAINLAREEDLTLLPAWICSDAEVSWEMLAQEVRRNRASSFAARGQTLGIPVAKAESSPKAPALHKDLPVRFQRLSGRSSRHMPKKTPLVLDFSSLWAGPLCGHFLTLAGMRVVKVESTRRPDGARSGNPDFYNLLHAGQESLALDFSDAAERSLLLELMKKADVIIEGSRPRAFEQLGFLPEIVAAANPSIIWLSITAYGRTGAPRNRVGFGDDVAAAAGLLVADETGAPCFVGDAIADPLTGITAAAAVFTSMTAGGGILIDAAMSRVAAFVAAAPPIPPAHSVLSAAPPSARPLFGSAPALGADTTRLLREFA